MKILTKIIFIILLFASLNPAFAADRGVSVCLKGDNYQNGINLRTFNVTLSGAVRSQTAYDVPLQTATAWMSMNFNITHPQKLNVTETTPGAAAISCSTANFPADTQWIGVTISYAPDAAASCVFAFSNTIPDPVCSNKTKYLM